VTRTRVDLVEGMDVRSRTVTVRRQRVVGFGYRSEAWGQASGALAGRPSEVAGPDLAEALGGLQALRLLSSKQATIVSTSHPSDPHPATINRIVG
jgi:hypothetical protein